MTDSTDPRVIEAELERERATLASTLDALSDRISVDNLARQALDSVKSYAGSYTSSIDTAVRANPLALALVGAGLAWFVLGNRKSSADPAYGSYDDDDEMERWASEGGTTWTGSGQGYRALPAGGVSSYQWHWKDEDEEDWSREARTLRDRASSALGRLDREARSYVGSARDFAAERAGIVAQFTADLKDRLMSGLEGMEGPARDTIVAAREKAYAARISAERLGRRAMAQPQQVLEEYPLVSGAVAFAVGAAVAAALPRTQVEDRYMGSESDRLMAEARHLFRTEKDRALGVASQIGSEVKAAAMDTVDAVTHEAKKAASTVAETAKAKAKEGAARLKDRADSEIDAAADRTDRIIG